MEREFLYKLVIIKLIEYALKTLWNIITKLILHYFELLLCLPTHLTKIFLKLNT